MHFPAACRSGPACQLHPGKTRRQGRPHGGTTLRIEEVAIGDWVVFLKNHESGIERSPIPYRAVPEVNSVPARCSQCQNTTLVLSASYKGNRWQDKCFDFHRA